jgi:EF-P beta-lysylation protein EpmB
MAILATPLRSVATSSKTHSARSWQESLRRAIRDPVQLCRSLQLPPQYEQAAAQASQLFGVFVPREYLGRMKKGDEKDPLLRQVLPIAEEIEPGKGFSLDPVGDAAALRARGLLHKYHSRVLLIASGACAVHCRYCFRRHFPYEQMPRRLEDWQPAMEQIKEDTTIEEVILSGGDPLMLTDQRLAELAGCLEPIKHVKRLRIHTRLPVMIPSRVTDSLLSLLSNRHLMPVVVVHINHPAEIDIPVSMALSRLVEAGILVLNQSVLLRGVNDSAEVLTTLSKRLVDLRVMPYYLHQLDRTLGTSHFEVPVDIGIAIIEQMRSRLPGYAMPRFVQENRGKLSKQVLA